MLIDTCTNFLNAFCHIENKENENLLKEKSPECRLSLIQRVVILR